METERITIDGRECHIDSSENAGVILIQAADINSLEHMDKLTAELDKRSGIPYTLVSFAVKEWNNELSPWEAAAVFGKDGFGGGAEETLAFVTGSLLPYIREHHSADIPLIIGGYSLAALFALWTVYKTNEFSACAAASPSVWFPGWPEFINGNKPSAGCISLSLPFSKPILYNAIASSIYTWS